MRPSKEVAEILEVIGLTRFCLCAPDLGLPWGELSLHIPQICPASSRSFHSVPHTVLWMAQMWRPLLSSANVS